ncbi:MAG: oligosaccharide repeat unit polymerase [Chloroflexi bacterium]|nr:MAG: oligosaccharide repeat unit polymerase [Chloroflexota bacterium]
MHQQLMWVTISLVLISNLITYSKTRDWFNPVMILSITFFLPLVASLLRLSALQRLNWHNSTYVLIFEVLVVWLLFPTVIIAFSPGYRHNALVSGMSRHLAKMESSTVTRMARLISLTVIFAFLLSNYLQTNSLIPWFGSYKDSLHVEYVQGLRMVARAIPFASSILLVLYMKTKRKLDLILFGILVLLPLSRGARIDTFFAILAAVIIIGIMLRKIRTRFVLFGGMILVVGVMLLALMGNIRASKFGLYEFDYAKSIAFVPNPGPLNTFAILYGYFALPFENFDIFVRTNLGHRTFGLASLEWLFVGFLKLNLFFPGLEDSYRTINLFQPISGASTVATGLVPFFLDFGVVGAWVLMGVYMSSWLFLYRRSRLSVSYMVLYALVSASFALSCFQPIVTSPYLFYQLLYTLLFFRVVSVIRIPRDK